PNQSQRKEPDSIGQIVSHADSIGNDNNAIVIAYPESKMRAAATMAGRKGNKSKPKQFTVSVPMETWNYLEYMAQNGILGPSESIIASHLVIREIDKMKNSR